MRLAIFTDCEWALGSIHRGLAGALTKLGHVVELVEWANPQPPDVFDGFDRVMTLPSVALTLASRWRVPEEKIIAVAHGECDIQKLIDAESVNSFDDFAAYGVVSDSLACSSLALGVRRIPTVVRLGVEFARFVQPPAERLTTVGYASVMARCNEAGVEQKRGWLAKAAAEAAGLEFVAASGFTKDTMPDFYRSVDAVIMPSLQEGAGLPPLEAAAAGRLVIGTPVGHFPRLAYEGLGVMGPLGAEAFLQFAAKRLTFYKRNAEVYRTKCAAILDAAQGRDWSRVVDDWLVLLGGGE